LIEKDVKGNRHQPFSCPICLEEFSKQPTRSLACGHKYCIQCLSLYVSSLKKLSTCPICRTVKKDEDLEISKAEAKFRLETLQRKFPDFVSKALVTKLSEEPLFEDWTNHYSWKGKQTEFSLDSVKTDEQQQLIYDSGDDTDLASNYYINNIN